MGFAARKTGLKKHNEPRPVAVTDISPVKLIVRCVAFKHSDQWQAFSLEFGLAAQADTFPEVKQKLHVMIRDYLDDALIGEDRGHAFELLNRRAAWWVYARYYAAGIINALRAMTVKRFCEQWDPRELTV